MKHLEIKKRKMNYAHRMQSELHGRKLFAFYFFNFLAFYPGALSTAGASCKGCLRAGKLDL